VWAAFENECQRVGRPRNKVMVVGGNQRSFEPDVVWDDIVLPAELKAEIIKDVESFFAKGVAVYERLKLKPFRKLLLAGVPGTGKTMICTALARWGLERDYQVIYVSSASISGPNFVKIQQALHIAAESRAPSIILLEELDAYLHEQQKALILNVLDGSESFSNPNGTLLVATTNYPEVIDDRVLKRPGRLDRIYIIPEVQREDLAIRLLRRYLGDLWHDDHTALADKLVGYPGAFVREVVVYALTQLAYDDGHELPLSLLADSFDRLHEQIAAKDDFLVKRRQAMGFDINERAG
jgi:SpoVK/Ycf46/Vps4 family AAA+-type ATPase